MRRFILLSALSCLLAGICAAGDLQSAVRAVEDRFDAHRTHIPMLGMVKLFVRASSPSGVGRFDVATIEGLRYSTTNSRVFRETVERSLRGNWHPLVQVETRSEHEYAGIFARTEGSRLRLIVAALDRNEASFVEVRVSADTLVEWLREPRSAAARVNGERGSKHDEVD